MIARYEGRLGAFARSRLRGVADADDAVQETFLGFLQSLPNYDSSRSLETYLFAIARYKIGDACRRRRIPIAADFATDEEQMHDFADRPGAVETPSGILLGKESREQQEHLMTDALRGLIREYGEKGKFRDLQIIELSMYVGRRNKEIATRLDMDEKHVAGVKFRAIARLRELIAAADHEPGVVGELTDEASVARVWRERRVSCLKRSTLGAYLAGVLDAPWSEHTRFHVDVVGCPFCKANLDDLEEEVAAETGSQADARLDRLFVSSVGFLRTTRG